MDEAVLAIPWRRTTHSLSCPSGMGSAVDDMLGSRQKSKMMMVKWIWEKCVEWRMYISLTAWVGVRWSDWSSLIYWNNSGAYVEVKENGGDWKAVTLRARQKITSHFHISSSGHLRPILNRKILEIVPLLVQLLVQLLAGFCNFESNKSDLNLDANYANLFYQLKSLKIDRS